MILADTNIFLEIMLDQQHKDACISFLSKYYHFIYVSDFSLYSIGIIMTRQKKADVFHIFLQDFIQSDHILALPVPSFDTVIEAINKFRLDFDDAYQYSICNYYHLQLFSYDKDFDTTDLIRNIPSIP